MPIKKSVKLDKETRDLLTEQEKIKLLTEHDGWPIVKKIFMDKIAKFLNISDMNPVTPMGGSLIAEVGIRQGAATKLIEVINDIEGTASQFDANQALTEEVENTYIYRAPVRK